MASPLPNDDEIRDGRLRYGNDEPPLMSRVPEPAPSHWGKCLTDRTRSEAYTKFLLRARKQHSKTSDRKDECDG